MSAVQYFLLGIALVCVGVIVFVIFLGIRIWKLENRVNGDIRRTDAHFPDIAKAVTLGALSPNEARAQVGDALPKRHPKPEIIVPQAGDPLPKRPPHKHFFQLWCYFPNFDTYTIEMVFRCRNSICRKEHRIASSVYHGLVTGTITTPPDKS